jgi:hypothetical protein
LYRFFDITFFLLFFFADSNETSGHISVSGGITPYINERTKTIPMDTTENATLSVTNHDSLYYLGLWTKVLSKKSGRVKGGVKYKITVDTDISKACISKVGHSAIFWISLKDANKVRNLYINFRLCGDDFAIFFKHLNNQTLEDETISTPPVELNFVSKYNM